MQERPTRLWRLPPPPARRSAPRNEVGTGCSPRSCEAAGTAMCPLVSEGGAPVSDCQQQPAHSSGCAGSSAVPPYSGRTDRVPRSGAMLSLMSLWEAGLIVLLVAGGAAVAWRLQTRPRDPSHGAGLSGPSGDPPRFETTMGELRDLREALRDAGPAKSSKGAAQAR
jgi:hypothetical protein